MKSMAMHSRLLVNNIPLHCNICPKKPDFSDVSHLLTHIASKGHLSTYYKIKVKASNEDTSRQIIDEYDTWYAMWNIEDLMSDRLNLKDKRKAKPRNVVNGPLAQMPPMAQYQFPQTHMPFPRLHYEHAIDPRLGPQTIKTESNSRSGTPTAVPLVSQMMMHNTQHAYANPMVSWQPQYMYVPANQDYDDEQSSEASFIPGLGATFKRHADSTSLLDDEGDVEEVHETSKLKGVLWPGMDMFDAAPPEQRRKRNQKKDTSVVKQLEAMSQTIEATEHVFSPLGTHCKSRPISGLPDSDDIPLPGEETPPRPKKAKRAPRRKPLAERDPNTNRKPSGQVQKRGRPARAATVASQKRESPAGDSVTQPIWPRRKKKGLQVYRDEDEATFEKPAEMATLNSGFIPPAQYQRVESRVPATAPAQAMETTYTHQQSYYAYPPHAYYAPAFEPHWNAYSHDINGSMANPLFLGTEHGNLDFEDDDELTVSVPDSDE